MTVEGLESELSPGGKVWIPIVPSGKMEILELVQLQRVVMKTTFSEKLNTARPCHTIYTVYLITSI